jgi:hypothetical protein
MNADNGIPEPKTPSSLVEELNEKMIEAAASSAAQAFNISCLMSVLIIAVLVTLAYIFSHLVTAIITLLMTLLIATSLAALLSMRARNGNIPLTYQREIEPQIVSALGEFNLSRHEFDTLADDILPTGAPLKQFLFLSPGSEAIEE